MFFISGNQTLNTSRSSIMLVERAKKVLLISNHKECCLMFMVNYDNI